MVHGHNIEFRDFDRDPAIGRDFRPVDPVPEAERKTFRGFVRADGRVGTRNYIAIVSTVNCSATVSQAVADWFTQDRLAEWPNVDGVAAFTHSSGCGMEFTGERMDLIRRTLGGYMKGREQRRAAAERGRRARRC
jgi:altronate hydrolase